MSQALYRKWRPARFDEVIGQEHVTRTLRNATAAGRIGHAYLFCGPRGTGKTTTARLLAKAVNCLHEDLQQRPCNACSVCQAIGQGRFLDLIEIDAASNTGVDDIRDLRDKINFSPNEGRYKVYIIDEVHMLSTAAFNALLKTLEEPPPHAIFVLATTEEHKVPLTIKSRCQQFNFRLLTVQEITNRLQWLAQQEGLTVEPEAIALIARHGEGSLRDAESLLDQLVAAPGDVITLERAQMVLGTASSAAITALTAAWLAGDGPAGLRTIHEALASGADARQFCRQMVAYLRQLLLLRTAGPELALDVPAEQKVDMQVQAQQAGLRSLIEAIKRFNEAAVTPSASWQPQLPLELAYIELLPDVAAGDGSAAAQFGGPTLEVARPQPAPPADTGESVSSPDRAPVGVGEKRAEGSEPEKEDTDSAGQPVAVAVVEVASTLSLAMVTARWREIVARVGQQNKNLPALLAMCKPLAIEGEVLILGFDFPILKEKFESTPQARQLMAAVLSDVLGLECAIRCVMAGDYVAPPAPTAVKKEDFYALAQELGGVVVEN